MATEFNCTINKTGEDYGSLTSWEAAIQCDLTSAATKVFSHGAITGTISDGASLTGLTSGATGTCQHCSSSQILISSISGTFQNGEVVYQTLGVNFITLSDAGDSAIAIAQCYDDDGDLSDKVLIDGSTTNSTNYMKVTVPLSERHSGTASSGFKLTRTQSVDNDYLLYVLDDYFVIEFAILKIVGGGNNGFTGVVLDRFINGLRVSNCIIYATSEIRNNKGVTSEGNATQYVYNCILYGWTDSTFGTGEGLHSERGSAVFYNNTLYNCRTGITGSSGDLIKNNLSLDSSSACYSYSGATVSNNGSSDATGTLTGLSSSTEVVSTTATSENLHLKAGASSINAGTNLGSPYDVDIDGYTRTGTWDIGADEFVSVNTFNALLMAGD